MKVKAIILDLDNTIYPVSDIGEKVFKSLFEIIEESGEYKGNLQEIKQQLMRQPFQKVAEDFSFGEELKANCLQLLNNLTYNDKMEPFDGYQLLKQIPCKKYLVTTGFTKLQYSKIDQLGIRKDFDNVYVVDPSQSDLNKKDVFQKIINENNFNNDEVLVVGDDLESEIKAAEELGINTVLYNHNKNQDNGNAKHMISSFDELKAYIE